MGWYIFTSFKAKEETLEDLLHMETDSVVSTKSFLSLIYHKVTLIQEHSNYTDNFN